jgi:hypothetical protein
MAISVLSEFSYTGSKGDNLITDIATYVGGAQYFKKSDSGIGIELARNASSFMYIYSNEDMKIRAGKTYRATFYIKIHSGEAPDIMMGALSSITTNEETVTDGYNSILLTNTVDSEVGLFAIRNTTTALWSMSDVDLREIATSDLLSPFMNPVLYFSVSGASGVTSPTAEIEFDGTTEDVTIEATFIETVSTVHYFQVDLSDLIKYLMKEFDGGSYPDDLEFITGPLLQKFDEYFRSLTIDIYFERGTGDEQTDDFTNWWLYLSNQMPYTGGFNLLNVYNLECLQDLKWNKETYNALFFWHESGIITIKNKTTDKHLLNIYETWYNDNDNPADYDINGLEIPQAEVNYSIQAINYFYNRKYNVVAGQVITFKGDVSLISGGVPDLRFFLYRSTGVFVSSQTDALADGVNIITYTVSEDGYIMVDINDTSALAEYTVEDVSITGVSGNSGFYQFKFDKENPGLQEGLNEIEITAGLESETITIEYHDCEAIPVCWQHPLLGYVSFPFNGNKVTSQSGSKTSEIGKFVTSMQSVNTLKEVMGYDESRRVTLTTKADSKYFDLLRSIYSSRHVYLFIGQSGDEDNSLSWVECEVSGSGASRSDRVRGVFTVDLLLPESFNIKF